MKVDVVELIGTQELELSGQRPANHKWPYPIAVQVYFLCRVLESEPFVADDEATERGYFPPTDVRQFPSMVNHDAIYEEALRRSEKF